MRQVLGRRVDRCLQRSCMLINVAGGGGIMSGTVQKRFIGADFLVGQAVGDTRSLNANTVYERGKNNALAVSNNKEILDTLSQHQTGTEITFRKHERPWEIVPHFVKRRVVDMVGLLTSEHRMEMELTIKKILPICDIDLYVVVVPTVGYVPTRSFAKSIFFDWGIGEPRGNGVLLCVAQHEASVQVITSPAIAEFFGQEFVDLLVKDIMQPLLREGRASYAMVQATYALARHAQEARHLWQQSLVPLPVKNKLRFAERVVHYGVRDTYYFWGALFLVGGTIFIWQRIFDLMCPDCGTWMHRVTDEALIPLCLTEAQRMEWENGCTEFMIQKCPKCKHSAVHVALRDMYNDTRCLKCEDCENFTVTKETDVIRLATKTADGLKRETFKCQFCRVGREVDLPLYRPLDSKPEPEVWYDFLLQRAADGKTGTQKDFKLV